MTLYINIILILFIKKKGWLRIYTAKELKVGESKFVIRNGRHLALFRGQDAVAYVVDAYCTHMGANLAIGGQVKWTSCIECPFHGWAFNVTN